MFDWVLNMSFICSANQLNDFYFIRIFTEKVFSKQAIEIWILIPIILRNMFRLHTKKIYTKYDKICVFEKIPHENYHREKKSWVEWSGISLLLSKSMPWLVRVYIKAHFSTLLPFFTRRGLGTSKSVCQDKKILSTIFVMKT